jgi:hypothetical protein
MSGAETGAREGLIARTIAASASNPWLTLLFVAGRSTRSPTSPTSR